MLENPQSLINIDLNGSFEISKKPNPIPDAIYIPFLNRYKNLNELLSSLNWYEKQIFILISSEKNSEKIDVSRNQHVHLVDCSKSPLVDTLKNLKTLTPKKINSGIQNWDLPIKRNFALCHAIQNSFGRILLIDDDIGGITEKVVCKGVKALDTNNITGCLVEGFPDTSVIGHIEQKCGEPYYPFLSGNFLFIRPDKAEGFFPLVYNEDWLFMTPSIIEDKISAVGVIYQKEYDPFDNNGRVRLQEFGEIIAEGLFELISLSEFSNRFNESFWDDYLAYRKSYVTELLQQADDKFVPFIKESLSISEKIKATDCVDFIRDWEEDILMFKKIKRGET